jgi:hypothetical protein
MASRYFAVMGLASFLPDGFFEPCLPTWPPAVVSRYAVVPGNECFQLGGGVAKEIDGGTKGLSCQGRAM